MEITTQNAAAPQAGAAPRPIHTFYTLDPAPVGGSKYVVGYANPADLAALIRGLVLKNATVFTVQSYIKPGAFTSDTTLREIDGISPLLPRVRIHKTDKLGHASEAAGWAFQAAHPVAMTEKIYAIWNREGEAGPLCLFGNKTPQGLADRARELGVAFAERFHKVYEFTVLAGSLTVMENDGCGPETASVDGANVVSRQFLDYLPDFIQHHPAIIGEDDPLFSLLRDEFLKGDAGKALRVCDERADDALNMLPPHYFSGGFALGEPYHHTEQGQPVFACFMRLRSQKCHIARYLTITQANNPASWTL